MQKHFELVADVSSDDPGAIEETLRAHVGVTVTPLPDGFHVEGTLVGESARDLNRALLSALRRVERRTRLRAQWSDGEHVHRFFDYVEKSVRPAP